MIKDHFNFLAVIRGFVIFAVWALFLIKNSTCSAQADHNFGNWFSVNTQGDIGLNCTNDSRLKWWFDGHLRLFENADGYGQSIVRPGLGYVLSENWTAWVGYGWINESPANRDNFDENRIFQQLIWTKTIGKSQWMSRSRLEQRFVETGDDTGWRFRHFAKYLRPFDFEPRLSAVFWDEAFFDLNETDWGQSGSFSQNRAFVGVGWTMNSLPNHPRVEIGYMHQYLRRGEANDGHNHVLGINWFANF